jgi:hypothetical protein
LGQLDAFAPLNGLVAPSPPPFSPDAAAALKEKARKQLDVAASSSPNAATIAP